MLYQFNSYNQKETKDHVEKFFKDVSAKFYKTDIYSDYVSRTGDPCYKDNMITVCVFDNSDENRKCLSAVMQNLQFRLSVSIVDYSKKDKIIIIPSYNYEENLIWNLVNKDSENLNLLNLENND